MSPSFYLLAPSVGFHHRFSFPKNDAVSVKLGSFLRISLSKQSIRDWSGLSGSMISSSLTRRNQIIENVRSRRHQRWELLFILISNSSDICLFRWTDNSRKFLPGPISLWKGIWSGFLLTYTGRYTSLVSPCQLQILNPLDRFGQILIPLTYQISASKPS